MEEELRADRRRRRAPHEGEDVAAVTLQATTRRHEDVPKCTQTEGQSEKHADGQPPSPVLTHGLQ